MDASLDTLLFSTIFELILYPIFCKVPDPYPRPFWMIKLPKKMRMSEIFNGTGMEVSKK